MNGLLAQYFTGNCLLAKMCPKNQRTAFGGLHWPLSWTRINNPGFLKKKEKKKIPSQIDANESLSLSTLT